MDDTQLIANEKSAEAVQAAVAHQQAVEDARKSQLDASIFTSDERISRIVSESIVAFFNHGSKESKYIDVGRIPFICESIDNINLMMAKTAVDAKWTKWLTGTLLTVSISILGWMILQIIKYGTQIAIINHTLSSK